MHRPERPRPAVVALLLIVSAVAGLYASHLRVDPGVESVVPAAGADPDLLRELDARFGTDEVLVLALEADPLFTAENLALIEDLSARAAALPHVRRVLSPTRIKDIDGDELGPFVSTPYEKVLAGAMDPAELGRRLAAHPIFSNLLVSADARAAAVLMEIGRVEGDDAYRSDLVARARALAAQAERAAAGRGLEALVAGLPVEKVDLAASVRRDQATFAPLIFLVLGGVLALLYRSFTCVAAPLCVVAVSLLWTLGLTGMAGRALNPITALITPVVLVVSVAEAVHLINHHLVGLAEGLDPDAALRRARARARVPCFNAALTTAIGFGSLLLLPIPAIRDFGLFTSAGVMISYLQTMVLGPALLFWLPAIPPRVWGRFRPGPVERFMKQGASWVCRRPAAAGVASVVVLALSAAGVMRIRVETDIIRSMRSTSPLYRATAFIDRRLTGVNSMEILVRGADPGDPEAMERVARFEQEVRRLAAVRHVSSLPDLYARVNRAFHEGDDAWERLPGGAGAATDLADIAELLGREAPDEVARFAWRPAPGAAGEPIVRVAVRVEAIDTAASQALFEEVRAAARRAGLPRVDLTGAFVVLSNMSTSLVRNQIQGLAPAILLILAAMAVQFRSIRLGLLSAIPNGAPVLMVYGLMGWAGIPLSVPTAMIASIAIGMTVDNTIHLMARFREEFEAGRDYEEALDAMLDTSGRAVVFSTLTVALGFLVGVTSSFLPSVHFAVLIGAALLLGLACEAVLLPLTLILFKPFGRPRRKAAAAALVAALLLPAAGAPAWAASGAPPAPAPLKDQFGRSDGPTLHRGTLVLLIYGKSSGLRRMKAWEERIRERAPGSGFVVLRGLDARKVAGRRTEAEVNARLREGVPKEISILIDWKGEFVKAYAMPEAEVVVAVLDPAGAACGVTTGPVEAGALGGVLDLMASVERKGTCP